MGTTANLGIEYPDPSGVPSRQSWIEDPIKSVDAKVVAYLGKRVKGGSSSGTIEIGQASVDVVVTFNTPFATAPDATASAGTTSNYQANVISRSTASITVKLMRPFNAATTAAATVPFTWTATDLGNS